LGGVGDSGDVVRDLCYGSQVRFEVPENGNEGSPD
jgi:hypothetical protein